jgi:hypothetical protein
MITNHEQEFTIKNLSEIKDNFLSGIIFEPDYQRGEGIWTSDMKSNLIKSIFEGTSIGEIKLNKIRNKDGKYIFELVDGLQRTSIIRDFISGNLKLSKDVSYYVIEKWLDYFKKDAAIDNNINKILVKFEDNKNINLTYFDLLKDLRSMISNYKVAVSIKSMSRNQVEEYFRMVQSGKGLSEFDMIHTVNSKIKDRVNDISNNDNFLNYVGLIVKKSGGINEFNRTKKKITKNIIEVIAALSTQNKSIGTPKGLHKWLAEQDENNLVVNNNISLINDFINKINIKNNPTQYNQIMIKLLSILILVGHNRFKYDSKFNINEFARFIFNITLNTPILYKMKLNSVEYKEFMNQSIANGMYDYYNDDINSFIEFSKLKSGGHSSNKAINLASKLVDIYTKNYQDKINQENELLVV